MHICMQYSFSTSKMVWKNAMKKKSYNCSTSCYASKTIFPRMPVEACNMEEGV